MDGVITKEDIKEFENAPPSIQFAKLMKSNDLLFFDECWYIVHKKPARDGKKFMNDVIPNIQSQTNEILQRWVIFLQQFDFIAKYLPGKDNFIADYLSRDVEELSEVVRKDLEELRREM